MIKIKAAFGGGARLRRASILRRAATTLYLRRSVEPALQIRVVFGL
jgi:hypothetical protein